MIWYARHQDVLVADLCYWNVLIFGLTSYGLPCLKSGIDLNFVFPQFLVCHSMNKILLCRVHKS